MYSFIDLGCLVTRDNDVSLEIKRREMLGNRSYFELNRQANEEQIEFKKGKKSPFIKY